MNKSRNISVPILLIRLISIAVIVLMLSLSISLTAQGQQKPERAYRITLEYDNGKVDPLRIDSLFMIIPLTIKEQTLKEGEHPQGYFFEIFDEEENVLMRSNMEDPTLTLLEYEDPENPGRIIGEWVKHDEMTFSLIIPALAEARSIHFVRIIPGQDSIPIEKRRSEVLGTFSLPQD